MATPKGAGSRRSRHQVLEETLLHAGWTRLMRLRLRTADGQEVLREVEDHGQAVAVLVYDPQRATALLVSMARGPIVRRGEADLLEAAAGLIDPGESPEAAVRREAREELGVELAEVEPLGAFWPMPGLSCEQVHLYLAACGRGQRVAAGGGLPAEDEHLVVHEVGLGDLAAELADGRLRDMKTALLVMALRSRRPDLF